MTNRNYLGGRRWARLRRRILDRDKWRCQECGAAARLQIDHVLREKAGGARFDEANLQALCVGLPRGEDPPREQRPVVSGSTGLAAVPQSWNIEFFKA